MKKVVRHLRKAENCCTNNLIERTLKRNKKIKKTKRLTNRPKLNKPLNLLGKAEKFSQSKTTGRTQSSSESNFKKSSEI